MAVTIDEMQVEVKGPAPAKSPSPSAPDSKKEVDLRVALEILQERKQRLHAD